MPDKLDDVARLAGVSAATVSRALRGVRGVAEGTRARVLAAAAELGYAVSPAASSLATGRTGTVGVIVPYVDRWYFSRIISGVERVLREAGISLLLYNLGDDAGRARFFAEFPLRRRVDAVLVLSLPLSEAERAQLLSLGAPLVTVGTEEPGADSVGIDDHGAAVTAMRHLVQLGHREIGFIGETAPVPLGFTTPLRRLAAYREVYHAVCREDGRAPEAGFETGGGFTVSGGEQAMGTLLGLPRRPSAVFAASDEMAFGALRALRRAGLRVPHDVSVLGFDDHDLAGLLELSTVAQPVAELGEHAGRLLLARLSDGKILTSPAILRTRLVLRGSTAPPTTR
ncbi:LacI family DNA-binding transcriptional regulator [Amycolatopsis sp., V23-08]|uniref:LacI family DNA-binding transcriptional regulator n=1 Tax=Amycolatopsis heterodermiae TaxID=3110235 RepID=A0ABU5R1U3_9PSEU|nr:LacI family DNA-binding transcriptional regulator [Amycolatopsis sp., V23-08]MEA5360138.1 LacI family DNA-binding transcriptional regulator [Amycolatopsis sp., V23-08]